MPAREEIAALPKLARVALALRCARRVQPLITAFWPEAPDKHIRALGSELMAIERYIEHPQSGGFGTDFGVAARATAKAARAAAPYHSAASDAAAAAEDATEAAKAAFAEKTGDESSVYFALAMAQDASTRAVEDATFAHGAIRNDFDLLRRISVIENWTDDTPVPPEFFGPMWPDGPPEGWPEAAKEERAEGRALEITLDIPDDATDEEVLEILEGLGEDMERFYRACGGRGLTIGPVEITSEVTAPVGAPS